MLYKDKYPIPDSVKYVIDYVYDGRTVNYYYQVVRIADDAILCSSESMTRILIECWKRGIPYDKTAII